MKMKPRKPSLKKSFKAKTTGKMNRQIKKSVNPLYGKKGMGWVNDPKKLRIIKFIIRQALMLWK